MGGKIINKNAYIFISMLYIASVLIGCNVFQHRVDGTISERPHLFVSLPEDIKKVDTTTKKDSRVVFQTATQLSMRHTNKKHVEQAMALFKKYIELTDDKTVSGEISDRRFFARYATIVLENNILKQKKLDKIEKELKKQRKRALQLKAKNKTLEKKIINLKKLDMLLEKQRVGKE